MPHTGLEPPRTSRAQAGLLLTRLVLALHRVRMATAHDRIASNLRKRGEPPRVVGDAKAKGPIERRHAPEEVCHRLLAAVKARAHEVLGREGRYLVITPMVLGREV